MELTAEQGRVLGALVEKERTTPQGYPLTDNALVAACNQTTSRDPVVSYDLATVRMAVREMRELGLLRTVHRSGERSDKHRHELEQALGLSAPQAALLAVLLLRGPQTLAELRSRTERLHAFASADEVERELAVMAERDEPLVGLLPRSPGRKEARFGQLLAVPHGSVPGRGGAPAGGHAATAGSGGSAGQTGAYAEAELAEPVHAGLPESETEGLVAVVADLAEQVATLRREVEDLRTALERATGA